MVSGSPTLRNLLFTRNEANSGGAIYNFRGTPTLTHVQIIQNTAESYSGSNGGGMANSAGKPILTDVRFERNVSVMRQCDWNIYFGGGGLSNDGDAILTRVVFDGNTSTAMESYGNPRLTDVVFTNSSEGYAMVSYGDATLTNVSFIHNESTGLDIGDNPYLSNVLFAHNGGSGMRVSNGNPTVVNATFAFNAESGLGVNVPPAGLSATVTIYNSIAWGNQQQDIVGAYTGSHNLIGSEGGVDPLFVDEANGDLRLLPASPAIDAGDNISLPPDTNDLDDDGDTSEPLPLDLARNPRVWDGNGDGSSVVDLGAYEFCHEAQSTDATCGSSPPPAPTSDLHLSLFTSEVETGSVTLRWETEVEVDNLGFNLYRLSADGASTTQVNDELIAARGNVAHGAAYQFVDRPQSGHYVYLIKNVDQQGIEHLRGQVEVEAAGYFFYIPALSAPQ